MLSIGRGQTALLSRGPDASESESELLDEEVLETALDCASAGFFALSSDSDSELESDSDESDEAFFLEDATSLEGDPF